MIYADIIVDISHEKLDRSLYGIRYLDIPDPWYQVYLPARSDLVCQREAGVGDDQGLSGSEHWSELHGSHRLCEGLS